MSIVSTVQRRIARQFLSPSSTSRLFSSSSKNITQSTVRPFLLKSFSRPTKSPTIPAALQCQQQQQRHLHRVPALPYEGIRVADGIRDLYSPEAFDIAWTQYQHLLIENLNQLLGGTPDENMELVDIITNSAKDESRAEIFNYASASYNNHFFFSKLKSPLYVQPSSPVLARIGQDGEAQLEEIPIQLRNIIIKDFENLELLKKSIISTALACFSNAYVWLVVDYNHRLRILVTYNAGTPLGGAYRRQSYDANTQSNQSIKDLTRKTNEAISGGQYAEDGVKRPLLCVNMWQHAYLRDFGLRGKERYLTAWWNNIDWNEVVRPLMTSNHPQRPLYGG